MPKTYKKIREKFYNFLKNSLLLRILYFIFTLFLIIYYFHFILKKIYLKIKPNNQILLNTIRSNNKEITITKKKEFKDIKNNINKDILTDTEAEILFNRLFKERQTEIIQLPLNKKVDKIKNTIKKELPKKQDKKKNSTKIIEKIEPHNEKLIKKNNIPLAKEKNNSKKEVIKKTKSSNKNIIDNSRIHIPSSIDYFEEKNNNDTQEIRDYEFRIRKYISRYPGKKVPCKITIEYKSDLTFSISSENNKAPIAYIAYIRQILKKINQPKILQNKKILLIL